MDRFVTVHRQKDLCTVTASQSRHIDGLRREIGAIQTICVYGSPGVGKTFIVHKALEGLSYINLENTRIKFSESSAHLILDDIEFEGEVPRSLGSTIVIARARLPNFQAYIEVPPLPDEELLEIAEKYFEGDIEINSKNIRTMLTDLDFSHNRDFFSTPKDFVIDLICQDGSNPWDFVGYPVTDHGFSCGIVHENYVDLPDSLSLSDWFSLADLQDDYSKSISFFSFLGILAPAIQMGHRLDRETIRPGSSWTKFNNHKMRSKKFLSMSSVYRVDIDSLHVLNQYCLKDSPETISKLKSYGFKSSDLDVMNHLMLTNKMKPRALIALKKKLKT